MLGAQFENLGGGAADVQKFICDGLNGVDFGDGMAFAQTAPQLQVWTPSGYQMYFYLNDAYIDDNNMPAGWADSGGNYVNGTVSAGQGAWFKDANGAATLTIPGQIVATTATIETTANKFYMGAYPFPAAVGVNSDTVTWNGIAGVDFGDGMAFAQTAPQLQVWTPSGYQMYYYLNDAYIDDNNMPAGWADSGGNYVNGEFQVGYGFWFKAGTDVDITFASPIAE